MAHRVTLIPGDGTGPELTEATRRVLEATGVDFDWDVREAGVDVMEEAGTPLPEETLASVKANGVAIKGPITRRVASAISGPVPSPGISVTRCAATAGHSTPEPAPE